MSQKKQDTPEQPGEQDKYDIAFERTPAYCQTMLDLHERWKDEEPSDGELMGHLWNLGGEG